jgi:hypothetical protein
MDSILGGMFEGLLGSVGEKTPGGIWRAFSTAERFVLAAGSIACGFACICIGSILGVPTEPHFSGSLFAGAAPLSGIIVAAFAIAVSMLIGLLFSLLLGVDAGLFCCCMGLAALGVHCGPMRPVLQYAHGNAVLIILAIENAILGAMLIGGWFGLNWLLHRLRPSAILNSAAPNEDTEATLSQKFATLGVQIVAMALCEQILIQTDYQAQAMAGTMISGFVGSFVAYQMFRPLSEGIWYWTGPAVLGVIGYLLAFLFADGLAIGDLHGWAGPLARPTPLIYISMGTAGALVGYWCSRRWAQPEGDGEDAVAPLGS